MRRLGVSLFVLASCAASREPVPQPPAPTCADAEAIETHERESRRLSEAAHEARREAEAARRRLAEAEDDATRAEAQQTIDDKETEAGVYFGTADEHHFEAKRLRAACER